MKKKSRGIVALVAILAVYLVVALIIPFQHTTVYWIGFSFGLVAIVVCIAGIFIAFKDAESARSKFYGFPIARVVVIYAIVQIIVSFILMAIGVLCPVWISIIVCIILLVIAVSGLVATDATRDEIERQDAKIKRDVAAMRALQSRINVLAQNCDSEDVKIAVKRIAEEFRFSDPVSNSATMEIESQMAFMMDEIEKMVLDGDNENAKVLIGKLSGVLKERNRLCKLNK